MLKPLLLLTTVLLCGFSSLSSPVRQSQEPAPAPPAPTTMKNPVKPTPESQARAKKVYGYDCAMCHGDNGNGKTDLATQMHLKMTDWTDPKALADMKDGELFDIIKNGKDKMPPEGDRVKTDDVWNLVIYVRSLGSEHSASAAKPSK